MCTSSNFLQKKIFIDIFLNTRNKKKKWKKLNFIIFHRIVDSHVCVFALGKSVRKKSAANEFKAFFVKRMKKIAYYLNISSVYTLQYVHFFIQYFFLRGPTKHHHHQQHWTCGDSLTYTNIFYLFFLSFIMNRMKMKINVCTIIYNYKVKSEKERQQKNARSLLQ